MITFLALLPLVCAGTYTLGSHQVSFNISEPYNSSAEVALPTFVPEGDSWMYNLEMMPDDDHLIKITVIEFPSNGVSSGDWLKKFENGHLKDMQEWVIGGHKYSTMDFKGYPAYQESFPTQIVSTTKGSAQYPTSHALTYALDEKTVVAIVAIGNDLETPYQDIIDTIEVIGAPVSMG